MVTTIPLKHFSHCLLCLTWIVIFNYSAMNAVNLVNVESAIVAYGLTITVLVVIIKLLG